MARLSEDDYGYDAGSYLDTREFQVYARKIRNLIHVAAEAFEAAHAGGGEDAPNFAGLTIGDIHRLLGPAADRSRTADALDSIKDIEAVWGALPTRYRPLTRLIKGLHKNATERFELKPPKAKGPDWFDYDERVRSF